MLLYLNVCVSGALDFIVEDYFIPVMSDRTTRWALHSYYTFTVEKSITRCSAISAYKNFTTR